MRHPTLVALARDALGVDIHEPTSARDGFPDAHEASAIVDTEQPAQSGSPAAHQIPF